MEILAASLVVLFQELALIRWLPAKVRVLAYFPNIVLLSAFLGLGIGALRVRSRSLLWLWPVSLTLLAGAAILGSNIAFTQEAVTEHLWLLYLDLPRDAPVVNGVRLPIFLCFLFSAITFVPAGQYVAARLREFGMQKRVLWGYAWDLGGSLLGVAGFAVISFLETKPLVWFALVFGIVLILLRKRSLIVLHVVAACLVLVMVQVSERASHYSPYYALSVGSTFEGHTPVVMTNGSHHQNILPMARAGEVASSFQGIARRWYHVPYNLLNRPPGRVLVLGAGTGNDVAVAVDRGAESVDAVEIDPVILRFGRELHPDRPYDSPLVHAINTDARAHLNTTDSTYDLIVFGTLDSMTRLSAHSNVRLDNFVYTKECLTAAKQHLAPGGGVVMYFMVTTGYIDQRLRGLLTDVFGRAPTVVDKSPVAFNRIYLSGSAFDDVAPNWSESTSRGLSEVELTSDDWPFLYLKRRGVSWFYLSLIGCIAAVALLSVATASTELRRTLTKGQVFDGEMFAFGLAFLLLETKFVTEMNLVWGATWLSSAVIFGSILAMILAVTMLMHVRPMRFSTGLLGIVGSLAVTYVIPARVLVGLATPLKLVSSALYVGVPIFFAGACFAVLFNERDRPDLAFAWNLVGAVVGGLLEFSSMAVGLKMLGLVAMGAYLVAGLLYQRRSQRSAAARC